MGKRGKGRKEEAQSVEELADRLAMVLMRYSEDLDQAGISKATRISASQVSDYDRGVVPIPRENLEKVAGAVKFPVSLLDFMLRMLRLFLHAGRDRLRADRVLAHGFAMEFLAVLLRATDLILIPRNRARREAQTPPRAEDRVTAGALLECLKRCTPAERRLLVEESREYRTWAVSEGAALTSVALAPNYPKEALDWAQLAVDIAERVPGEETWRWYLQGWALSFLSNALRACNDLPAAESALTRGRKLSKAGAPAALGLLNEAWIPGLEANLRRDQRRFPEALKKIQEALDLDRGALRAEILLSKARIYETLGDPETSTAVILEAEPLIDPQVQPRLAFGLRFNLLVDLCDLERVDEKAEHRFAEVQALAERLSEKLDLNRVGWLRGKISFVRGRLAEALADFEQVRREFLALELAFDFALVSLDESLVLLALGRTADVRPIAEEMLAIFTAQGVHREALAAVQVFCEAAKQEAATVELTRRVARFLRRSQVDPELRFEE